MFPSCSLLPNFSHLPVSSQPLSQSTFSLYFRSHLNRSSTMKLSFSISSSNSKPLSRKPKSKLPDDDAAHEYVTEFDGSKTLADVQTKRVIIPPIENEWKPEKKIKKLNLPFQPSNEPTDIRFEVESSDAAAADSSMSYGLNLRENSKSESGVAALEHPHESVEDTLLKKLKQDIRKLPAEQTLEDYAEVPVEGFGAALLAGYGWIQGRGIGRNAKEDVQIYQPKRGFAEKGFAAKYPDKQEDENVKKSKGDRGDDQMDSLNREKREREDKRRREGGPRDERVEHESSRTEEGDRGSRKEEERSRRREEGSSTRRDEERSSRRVGRREEGRGSRREEGRGSRREEGRSTRKEEGRSTRREEGACDKRELEKIMPWLTSHIRVRVISKDFRGGRFYLKKGEIIDVVGPTTCDISMDEGRELIQGVDQELLETALPRRGGPVLVLFGKHKGAYGNLMERDSEQETGVVRDADSHALLNVRLDQIAEYVGDPSYIGY